MCTVVVRGNMAKHLEQLARAADSLAVGDVIGRQIRSSNNWSLLPVQVRLPCRQRDMVQLLSAFAYFFGV